MSQPQTPEPQPATPQPTKPRRRTTTITGVWIPYRGAALGTLIAERANQAQL